VAHTNLNDGMLTFFPLTSTCPDEQADVPGCVWKQTQPHDNVIQTAFELGKQVSPVMPFCAPPSEIRAELVSRTP
jgi:hypothetical protein